MLSAGRESSLRFARRSRVHAGTLESGDQGTSRPSRGRNRAALSLADPNEPLVGNLERWSGLRRYGLDRPAPHRFALRRTQHRPASGALDQRRQFRRRHVLGADDLARVARRTGLRRLVAQGAARRSGGDGASEVPIATAFAPRGGESPGRARPLRGTRAASASGSHDLRRPLSPTAGGCRNARSRLPG